MAFLFYQELYVLKKKKKKKKKPCFNFQNVELCIIDYGSHLQYLFKLLLLLLLLLLYLRLIYNAHAWDYINKYQNEQINVLIDRITN